MADASSFIGREKESPILLDRPAESPAKLVLIEFWLLTGNTLQSREAVRIGVELRVPEKLVNVAMKVVGSRFCNHIHDRAGIAAVFGVKGVGQNTEFFNAVRRRLHGREVNELVVGVAAVYAEVIGAAAAAINRNRAGFVVSVDDRVGRSYR